jgi:hypothetical protein
MPEGKEVQKKEKGVVSRFLFWGTVLLAIYVFSVGPLDKYICPPGSTPPACLRVIYAPLNWLHNSSPVVALIMDWYVCVVWRVPIA